MAGNPTQEDKKIRQQERQQMRAAAATLRAIARQSMPVLIDSRPPEDDRFNGIALQWTLNAADADQSIITLRGLADRAGFQKRYSNPDTFADFRPADTRAALLYEALERARYESCGTEDFPGAGNNVQSLILHEYSDTPPDHLSAAQQTAVQFYFAARQVMTGLNPPPAYAASVREPYGDMLKNLPALMRNQEEYAQHTCALIQDYLPALPPAKAAAQEKQDVQKDEKSASWYKKIIRPLNFYTRDNEFYRRHATGPVSSRDIIEIEYGGAMPQGWNIADKPHQNKLVNITTPMTDKHTSLFKKAWASLLTLGYVNLGTEKKQDIERYDDITQPSFALNKMIFSPVGQAGALYLAQSVILKVAPLLAALNPVAAAKAVPLLTMWMMTSLRNQPLTQLFTLPFRPVMDTVGHENIHVLQLRDPHETRTGCNILKNRFSSAALSRRWDSGLTGKVALLAETLLSYQLVNYFRADCEIQARMNTLLTHNYPRWGRMPGTKHELWAALIGAGLRAPPAIHNELAQSTEDTSAFYKPGLSTTFTRAACQMLAPHIAEMNTAYWALHRKDLKEEFWRDTLPYIYGHLTELCGDPDGLRRMGYTGPVMNDHGPVPFATEDRKKFWAKCDSSLWLEITDAKRIEAQRGYYFEDSPGEKPTDDWSIDELKNADPDKFALLEARESSEIRELRQSAPAGATFIDRRTIAP